MSAFVKDDDRVVVPRWRDVHTTLRLGELAPARPQPPVTRKHTHTLSDHLNAWQAHQTLPFATNLLSVGAVLGRTPELQEAATLVLHHEEASPAATLIARRLLGEEPTAPTRSIKDLRAAVLFEPRNPLVWTELARLYANYGAKHKAIRAMQTALGLAPDARYVLRCAARMFVHFQDAEHAGWVLRQSTLTPRDPWLIAADIAIAGLLDRSPRLHKVGRAMIDNGSFADFHLADLRSALGTVELRDGNLRKGKKLLRSALAAPTDNTVAQVEWVSRRLGDFDVDPQYLATPYSFEARAWGAYATTDWDTALMECRRWLADEPFSNRAVILGTYVASSMLGDYDAAADIATAGLRANAKDQGLLNNLTFALASVNKLDDARTAYEQMKQPSVDDRMRPYWLATGGLLKFREGLLNEGRALYLEAIEQAGASSREGVAAMLYLAREEGLAQTPRAQEALTRARAALDAFRGDFSQALGATFDRILATVPIKK